MWYIIGKIEIAGNILAYVIANPETKQVIMNPRFGYNVLSTAR